MRRVDSSNVVVEAGYGAGVTYAAAWNSFLLCFGAEVVVFARERVLAALEDTFFGAE